ncbi:sensor histidine kinase [Roseibium aggregatum]|uniref:histidine kinase n=1 Tax=Roseibium aggregatum TaxID=187304 RepID=A0A939J391_9HYPH|nr:PAS-domain containing protein [Roseibium aggregatum]MBN9673991.1 PAS-domain containing protein [Roseibium aggregatum]
MNKSKHFIYGDFDPSSLLDSLASSMHQGFSVMDGNLDLVMINRTAMDLLALPVELLEKDRSLAGVLRYNAERGDYGPGNPEDLVQVRIDLAKMFLPHDFVRTRPDGTVIRVQGTPMENGGFITIYSDITVEHEQEIALKEARDQLEASLGERTRELAVHHDMLVNSINAIKDGLVIADPDGRVVLANNKMFEIYPQFPALLVRKASLSEIVQSVFPDEPDRTLDELSDSAMWTEREYPFGIWYKITRTRTDSGGMLCVYTDITKYKEQHSILQSHTDELVRHLRKEKELNEMQREFVSMASHEFRTPLAIIDSNAQRILRKIDRIKPEALSERLGNIRDSVQRMQYLIDRFLNFSQSQSVGMEIEREPVSLGDLVKSVCDRYIAITRTHLFEIDVAFLPEEIEIDKKLIEQSVSNLISNAIKYSPENTTIYVTGSEAGGQAMITVRDQGVGIPAEEVPKIFNRYFRASTSSGIAGTGIGLNMTKMILEKHGGKVHVESEVGQGTAVTVSLPVLSRAARRKKGQGKLKAATV